MTSSVVIIGGGVIGSSIAYHLASRADFSGSITVVERDPGYALASSSLSASSIREQFSTPINIAMSQFGLQFLHAAPELLAVDGDRPELSLRLTGYLFLAAAAGVDRLRENHRVQVAQGADVVLLTPAEIRDRFAWMATDGVALGSLGRSREGSFDGPALLAAFRRKARAGSRVPAPGRDGYRVQRRSSAGGAAGRRVRAAMRRRGERCRPMERARRRFCRH